MPTTTSSRVLSLIASVKTTFDRREPADDAVGREIQKVLSLLDPLPPWTGRFSQNRHPVTCHIKTVLQAGNDSTAALLDAIGPVIYFLPWHYTYLPREDAPDLEENVAFAEIIGPEAPFRSNSVCFGLTLIGPKTLYPPHRHPAVELYYVAAGTATWTLDGVSQDNPPGTFILHPSQAIHAMRTQVEPLLAIYSWSGADVRTASVYAQSTLSPN
jgi:quercetin dioxygenase-like cupin family protein